MRIFGVVILTITNIASTFGTILIIGILLAVYDPGSRGGNNEETYLLFLVGFIILVEILKWVSYYFLSFKKENIWLVFYGVYMILFLLGGSFLSLFVILLVPYGLSLYILYEQNKIDVST